ncbi:MAG: tRNA lysidine(34) synthetase TilS, partial [bacterium]
CNRNDIELYAQSKHISYRKDETNENLSFRRNKIRQVLIPLLTSEFNPEVSQHLARLSGILEEWDNYISDQVVELFSKHAQKVSQNEIIVGLPFFKLYFSWIQLTMIEFILNELQSGKKQVNFNQYQDFKHWIETGRIGSEFLWGIRLHCIKRKDRIVFRSVKEDEQLLEINIDAGKSYLLAATNIKMSLIEISRDELDYSNNPAIEFIAGDNLNFPLLLRPWNSGDLFRPLGSKFQKKVSDFLTDKKIGYPERKRIFVLLNKDEIVAVLGQQISENYRIKDRTKKIFRLKIDKVNQ